MARWVPRRRAVIAALLLAGVLVGCSRADPQGGGRDEPNAPVAATSADAAPSTTADEQCAGSGAGAASWPCEWARRFESADTYAQLQLGATAIVVHDRHTGATWSNANADTPMWAASTIKLAMAADLLQRDAAGAIELSEQDRAWIDDMLIDSDDYAADQLWYAYAGEDNETFNDDFAQMGMTDLQPQPYDGIYPYWGYQTCTARDLVALMNYVLDELAPPLRDQIVPLMQSVGEDQQWGVWAVGAAASPGVKDGWTDDLDDLSSVGFVGPQARYTVAIMDDLNGEVDFDDGTEIVSQVASLLFHGAF